MIKTIITSNEIHAVEQVSSMRVGGYSLMRCLMLTYGNNQHEALMPIKEEEFIRVLHKYMSEHTNEHE
jgi:hypothetical protein